MSQFFSSGGQSIGASASVLPMNIQDWFPLGLTGLICSTTVWKRQFFGTQPSLWSKWAYLLYKKLFWEKKGRKKYVDGDLVWRCFWAVMTGQKLDGCGRRWNRGRECEIIFNNLEWGEEDKVKREKLKIQERSWKSKSQGEVSAACLSMSTCLSMGYQCSWQVFLKAVLLLFFNVPLNLLQGLVISLVPLT